MSDIRSAVKCLFNTFGLELRGYNPGTSPTLQLVSAMQHFGVDQVLDVGANEGQFGREIRAVGYAGGIVSFEPLSSASEILRRVAGKDANWTIHARGALGDQDGEIAINVAGNSVSSSILPMTAMHTEAAPKSQYCGQESVPIRRLDSVAGPYLNNSKAPFLKIDTQGFEWKVLDGAGQTLPKIRGVLVELSLVPLYEGQHLWQDMIARLEENGFTLWALQQGFIDPRGSRTLQLDGIFFRSEQKSG